MAGQDGGGWKDPSTSPGSASNLGHVPDGANTYRLMSGFAAGETPAGTDEFTADEEAPVDELTQASKVVFSASS